MTHPPRLQPHFTRSEFRCVVKGIGEADVCKQVMSNDEDMAIPQPHIRLLQFEGDVDGKACYRPERLQRGKWEVA